MQVSGDFIRNIISSGSLFVSIVALTFSVLAFRYQYSDSIVTNVSTTGIAFKGKFMENADDQKRIVSISSAEISGGLLITVFNSGNREVSLTEVSLYLQPGDYQTLISVTPTPPCIFAPGSRTLYDLKGSVLFSDAKVIGAQHILSLPMNFPIFSPPSATGIVEQGIVCLKLQAFDYLGHGKEIQYPIGLIRAVQGVTQLPGPPPALYGVPRGSKLDDMHRLF
jgi:hypothetical protein